MTDADTRKPKQPHWRQRLDQIIADGKPLPPLLVDAMRGNFRPLQVGIYDRLTDYMAANGYTDENVTAMRIAVANIVSTKGYHLAIATDGSHRFDLDGKPVGLVDPEDRLAARVALLGADIRDAVAALEIATGKMSVLAKAAGPQPPAKKTEALPPTKEMEGLPPTKEMEGLPLDPKKTGPLPPCPDSSAAPVQKRISLPQVEIAQIQARHVGGMLEKAALTAEEIMLKRMQARGSR